MPKIQDLFNLTGRVAIVTGGVGLLGRQFCKTLAEAGARVVVADLAQESAISLAESLVESGYHATGVGVDVTDKDSVQKMVGSTTQKFSRLDILVNCAALDPKFDPEHEEQHVNNFEDYPLEAWNEALNINLTGLFLSCQGAGRAMKEQGSGSIINLCSTYGLVGPDQRIYERKGAPPRYKPVYYTVTKAGVLGLTRYLATYYAGTNIRANALTPGGIFDNHDETFLKAYAARTVMGRMAHPHEMNGGLLFLASDASSYMTGANLIVDGGWTAW